VGGEEGVIIDPVDRQWFFPRYSEKFLEEIVDTEAISRAVPADEVGLWSLSIDRAKEPDEICEFRRMKKCFPKNVSYAFFFAAPGS